MAILERTDVEKFTNPDPEDRSLRFLKNRFIKMYGPEWADFEIETYVADFPKEKVTPLLIAKLRLLAVMEDMPDRFYKDPMFCLHAMDIINGDLPDQDLTTIPSVTSLELAYALPLMREMYPNDDLNSVSVLSKIIFNNEGYTFVPKGFEDLLSPSDFPEEVSKTDSTNKQKAINSYLRLMEMADRVKND